MIAWWFVSRWPSAVGPAGAVDHGRVVDGEWNRAVDRVTATHTGRVPVTGIRGLQSA